MGEFFALALAIGIVFGARKLCDLIRAPLWFAKFLFIFAVLGRVDCPLSFGPSNKPRVDQHIELVD